MVSTELVVIPQGVRTRDWPRAQQCSVTKDDGHRCRRRSTRGARVCYVHGGQLPSVRVAAEAEVNEIRARALSIADRALDVVEDALEDKDPAIRLKAAGQLLDRVMPKGAPLVQVSVGEDAAVRSGAEIVRERLRAVRATMAQHPGMVAQAQAVETVEDAVLVDSGDWT